MKWAFIFLSATLIATDCTTIFEAKKDELAAQLESIKQQQQILESFRGEAKAAYEQSLADLKAKKDEVQADIAKAAQLKAEIEAIKAQNEKILAQLKEISANKISASYAKMKDQAAADTLGAMEAGAAAEILASLEPKKIAAIMAKMSAAKASELTLLLSAGPPFKPKSKESLAAPEGSILGDEN